MFRKLYRKLFPLKYLIRDFRDLFIRNSKASTDTIASKISESQESIHQQLARQHAALLNGLETNRTHIIESLRDHTSLCTTRTIDAVMARIGDLQMEQEKQWVLLNTIQRELHILQDEIRASKAESINLKEAVGERIGQIECSLNILKSSDNELKNSIDHNSARVSTLSGELGSSIAFTNYLLKKEDPKLDLIETFKGYAALRKVHSLSRSNQDLWVLWELKEKRKGYFVEFGAGDGYKYNNTYLLEKSYGWSGLLCEPQQSFHDRLSKNRSSIIDKRCVWPSSNKTLAFSVPEQKDLGKILEIEGEGNTSSIDQIQVTTISLQNLLEEHKAPNDIDLLSISIGGHEFDILGGFDFTLYTFKLICIDWTRNSKDRKNIHLLLSGQGYTTRHETCSENEDWYIRS